MSVGRRAVLSGAALALAGLPVRPVSARTMPAFALWPARPGIGGPVGPEHVSAHGANSTIAEPGLTMLRPVRPSGAAMLVAAGGGYRRIENGREADPAAAWLASIGITAFVLRYRLPGEGWNAGPLAPLADAHRAMRLIRSRAPALGLDPARIGALGFSAGAHLLGLLAAAPDWTGYVPQDGIDRLSARPAIALLIYPVVTLLPPFQHTATRRVLLGDHPAPEQAALWSVQTHVGPNCPPVFIVQAADDPVSDPANSAILEAACVRAGVPVERLLYAAGGHGFGLGRPGTNTAEWPERAEAWMRRRGFLQPLRR